MAMTLCCVAAAQSADDILRGAASKVSAAPSVEVMFTLSGNPSPVQGNAVISGGKFTLSTPGLKVWYDGNTQWTLLESTSEVSMTEPTAGELMETNPFAILSNYRQQYKARRLHDISGRKRVELTPLPGKNTEICRVVITVGQDGWPSAVEVSFSGDRVVSATVDHLTTGTEKPASAFRFIQREYPEVEIIDLR